MRKANRHSATAVLTADHPLATSLEVPPPTAAQAPYNDKAWSLMYKAITDGIGADPKNFQLIYPFTTWDWPITGVGYTSAAQWDFVSAVPQWSATGNYTSAGTSFDDTYGQMLNVVSAATTDPKLRADIENARNMLQIAANGYDTIYAQAIAAYAAETGGGNTPSFTEWLGGFGGRAWNAKLVSSYAEVESTQRVLNQLLSETTTPGLSDAQTRLLNQDYYTKYQDSSLGNFPPVPGYSIGMDATTWLNKVRSGTGTTSGSVAFGNSDASYDYKETWAGASLSVNQFFWSVKVGGAWQKVDTFATDDALSVTVAFEAWDQISISAGRWYNGAFVKSVADGPFIRGYSPHGGGNDTPVWGEKGIMSVQKVGMLVCYKPSFSITVSSSTFSSFLDTWNVASAIRIGPFEISGGGGSTLSGWKADASSLTFTGTTTAEGALILGANIQLINP